MTNQQLEHTLCPKVEQAFTLLGTKWMGLIILILNQQPQRFCQMTHQLPISEKVLSQRLKELERENIIVRQAIDDSSVHVEYALTEKGRAMHPIIKEITQWAEKWTS